MIADLLAVVANGRATMLSRPAKVVSGRAITCLCPTRPCRDELLAAQGAQLATMEQQLQEAQQGLACTMSALGITSSQVAQDPDEAAAAARPVANQELCKVRGVCVCA